MILAGENSSSWRRACATVTWITTNSTWTGLGSNGWTSEC